MTALLILSIVAIAVLVVLLVQGNAKFKKYTEQYSGIINVDEAIETKQKELKTIGLKLDELIIQHQTKAEELSKAYGQKRQVYESLVKEVAILEENLENISYGLYKPHYDYSTSEDYKKRLERIRNNQKDIIAAGRATFCPKEWQVGGSRKAGEQMVKEQSKLMLRAFNGECDAAIAKVNWSNINNMEARIEKAFEAINKLGKTSSISITEEYRNLKLSELRLEFELEEKLYKEKEEQRLIKEQMREEEKAQRELEKAQKQAEDEEAKYQKALEKARQDVEKATGSKLEGLNDKIRELEESLRLAQEQKQRAISQAQLTKSGHVYIISNIGSFGDNVYKIGMTRRLDPLDRVKELGDASVPFDFDVHALIYSENAPELENTFHKRLDHKRVNLVNTKREFFQVGIDEIERIAAEMNLTLHLTKLAEAKEHRASESIRVARQNPQQVEVNVAELERFPVAV